MHTPEHQKILDSMTPEEKTRRTDIRACRKRTIVKEYKHWFMIPNEFPHTDRGGEQYVLYERYLQSRNLQDKLLEREKIFEEYIDFHILRNPKKLMSVPGRLHFHIYR